METKELSQFQPAQLKADLEGKFLLGRESVDKKEIGLFYAPAGGSVHKVAKRIKSEIKSHEVDMFHVTEIKPSKMRDYKNIIIISSTVGLDAWCNNEKDEWAGFVPELRELDLSGHKVALVGLGNSVAYPKNFVDGLKDIYEVVKATGAEVIGSTPAKGYACEESRALLDGNFVGLPIDEDNEADKTDMRIRNWLQHLLP